MQHSRRVWIGCLIIILAYWCTYKGYESNYFASVKPIVKHAINYGLLVIVTISGYWGFLKQRSKWLMQVWLFIYTIVLFFIAILGVVDLSSNITNLSFRDMITNLKMFFTSPVPYGVLMMLARFEERAQREKMKIGLD